MLKKISHDLAVTVHCPSGCRACLIGKPPVQPLIDRVECHLFARRGCHKLGKDFASLRSSQLPPPRLFGSLLPRESNPPCRLTIGLLGAPEESAAVWTIESAI